MPDRESLHVAELLGDGIAAELSASVHQVAAALLSRLPRLTMTVGYDPRFSHGDYGIWVVAGPDRATEAADVLRKHGALEVRNER